MRFQLFSHFVWLLCLPVFLWAEPKNLAVEDVSWQFDNTVKVKITLQEAQFVSIYDLHNSQIEVRFYVGKNISNAKRVMTGKSYYMQYPKTSFNLVQKEACPAPGKYWAQIWLSVRYKDGELNDRYEDWYNTKHGSFSYTCSGYKADLKISSDFKTVDSNQDGWKDQLNLILKMDKDQYSKIQDSGSKVMLELFAHRDHEKILMKNRVYTLKQAASSYTLPTDEFCGELRHWWRNGGDKTVGASCHLYVKNSNGNIDERYADYNCPRETFICQY